jgi:hypothetical protein
VALAILAGRPINIKSGSVIRDPLPASVFMKPAKIPAMIKRGYRYHSICI